MNAATQNTWTSYRDGRRVMHYMRASGGRFFVQKVEAGYSVTFLADEGDGASVHMSTEKTLSSAKNWVDYHLCQAPATETVVLDARVKVGWSLAREIPEGEVITLCEQDFGRVTRIIEEDTVSPALKALMSRTPSWGSSAITLDAPAALPRYMKSFHRVRRYNRLNLSLDAWKVIATHHRHYVYTYEAALAQDARVCAIEQELWQYEGLKRTPVRDRRVKKLVKILKRLKRGLYE